MITLGSACYSLGFVWCYAPNSIAFPRQIAMYLSRRLTERSLKDIGQAFGGRDHGTVIHANKLVASRMEEDVRVRDIVQRLEEELRD